MGLLTVVAFKQSVAQDLPKVTYLTPIDRYLIFVFLVVSAVVVANAVVGSIEDSEEQQERDEQFWACLLILWILGNLFFCFHSFWRLCIRSDKMNRWVAGRLRENTDRTATTRWERNAH